MDQKLTPHISYLLYRHDCVIVPGFGGFVANYQAARIHPTQHTFSPPCKNIAFNRSLQNNDGLLANRIAEAENISYPEANQAIAREIENWNSTLETTKKLTIDRVGLLSFDVEQNLRFEPETKVNYLLDAFGLMEVQSPPVKREGAIDKLIAEAPTKKNPTKKAKVRKISPRLWKVAAAVLILIGMGGLAWLSYENGYLPSNSKQLAVLNPFSDSSWMYRKQSDNKPVIQEAKVTQESESIDAAPTESIQEEARVESAQSIEEVSPATNETAVTEAIQTPAAVNPEPAIAAVENQPSKPVSGFVPATDNLKAFMVVAGCFAVPANADKLVDMLRSKGYAASIAGLNNKGLTMVIYEDFDQRKEALVLLNEVKSKEDSTAWIFRY